jgi:hypothetical protein
MTRPLPGLWPNAGPDGREAMVGAIFAWLEVLGFERLEYELTRDAIDLGLDAALPPVIDLDRQIGGFGRGERTGTDTIRVKIARCRGRLSNLAVGPKTAHTD